MRKKLGKFYQKFFQHNRIKYRLTDNLEPARTQRGPTCGLNAIAQLIRLGIWKAMGYDVKLFVDDFDCKTPLLYIAKEMSLTRTGEMFKPLDFCRIGLEFGLHIERQRCVDKETYEKAIKAHIIRKRNVMVALDSDEEGMPIKTEGLNSHWVVIIGYFEIQDQTFVIVTCGNIGIKIFSLDELWQSTWQLDKTPCSWTHNFLQGMIITFDENKIDKKQLKDSLIAWGELCSSSSEVKKQKERECVKLQQRLDFLIAASDEIEEADEKLPRNCAKVEKIYHEIRKAWVKGNSSCNKKQEIRSELEKICRRARELSPGAEWYYNLQYSIGETWSKLKDFERALFYLRNAIIGRHAKYYDALCSLGEVFYQQGKLPSAITYFKMIDKRYEYYSEVQFLMGKIYFEQGRFVESYRHLKRVPQVHDLHETAGIYIGLITSHNKTRELISK